MIDSVKILHFFDRASLENRRISKGRIENRMKGERGEMSKNTITKRKIDHCLGELRKIWRPFLDERYRFPLFHQTEEGHIYVGRGVVKVDLPNMMIYTGPIRTADKEMEILKEIASKVDTKGRDVALDAYLRYCLINIFNVEGVEDRSNIFLPDRYVPDKTLDDAIMETDLDGKVYHRLYHRLGAESVTVKGLPGEPNITFHCI